MKKILMLLISIYLTSATIYAQKSEYESVMIENINQLNEAGSFDELQNSANAFDRIAQKETKKWRPLYYGAYSHILLSTKVKEADKMDKQLDMAQDLLQKAMKLSPDNSELYTLQGFIYMFRIPIDPGNRGPQFSGMGTGAFYRAIGIDPSNPRAHMLLSDMQFGTARFMGSNDFREACESLDKAIELYKSVKLKSELDPSWGSDWTEQKKKQCQ